MRAYLRVDVGRVSHTCTRGIFHPRVCESVRKTICYLPPEMQSKATIVYQKGEVGYQCEIHETLNSRSI